MGYLCFCGSVWQLDVVGIDPNLEEQEGPEISGSEQQHFITEAFRLLPHY